MAILSIQHPVAHYDAWKQVFDSDPVGRKPHGVIRHWIYQDADDPKYVVTNLKFVSVEEARKFLHEPALQAAWDRVLAERPQARVLEEMESTTY